MIWAADWLLSNENEMSLNCLTTRQNIDLENGGYCIFLIFFREFFCLYVGNVCRILWYFMRNLPGAKLPEYQGGGWGKSQKPKNYFIIVIIIVRKIF